MKSCGGIALEQETRARRAHGRKGVQGITPGERHVLKLVAEFRSCREIARHLALSEKTVENRRCGIIQKFQLRGHRGLMDFALRWAASQPDSAGLLQPPAAGGSLLSGDEAAPGHRRSGGRRPGVPAV